MGDDWNGWTKCTNKHGRISQRDYVCTREAARIRWFLEILSCCQGWFDWLVELKQTTTKMWHHLHAIAKCVLYVSKRVWRIQKYFIWEIEKYMKIQFYVNIILKLWKNELVLTCVEDDESIARYIRPYKNGFADLFLIQCIGLSF